jgi:hypothetical protein
MITAILKIKTSLPELAAECLSLFGEGSRLEDAGTLYWFKRNNTEPRNGYIRIPMLTHMAMGLEYVTSQGYVSPNAELIRIEWYGQDMVNVGTEEEPVYEEQLFQVGTIDITDEEGTVTGQRPEYLGRII